MLVTPIQQVTGSVRFTSESCSTSSLLNSYGFFPGKVALRVSVHWVVRKLPHQKNDDKLEIGTSLSEVMPQLQQD